jgi:fumarylacetoacetase
VPLPRDLADLPVVRHDIHPIIELDRSESDRWSTTLGRVSTTSSEQTWVEDAAGSAYDVDNLPYAVFALADEPPRVGTRIGDRVLDLAAAARATRPDLVPLLDAPSLDALLAAGPATWADVRGWAGDLLLDPAHEGQVDLHPVGSVHLRLPFTVADYVDYYASLDHATNVGRILRPDADPLLPNWRHLPVAYHGRAGSVVVSGTDIHRPCGQRRGDPGPSYGASQRLDIEAELGFVVGRSVPLGQRVPTSEYAETVFGVVGLNDWSARDIQAWEYVPLGPNLGKSFATTISAWVTPLAALEHARIPLPEQEPAVLPYLQETDRSGYDIDVEVEVDGVVVARPPYASMYWSPAQLLAHLTVNGASLRVGDLFASGTISGPAREQRGSFLELSWGGADPWRGGRGERTFLEDGDEVVLRYSARGARGRIGLGEVRGRILPALG